MDTGILPASEIATAANRLAAANFRANIAALGPVQPEWAERIGADPPDVQWIFARDGYLTARTSAGWGSGCSVPLRAGRELLKLLELQGNVGCFLHPSHSGQIRACFEKLSRSQAIIAVVPDVESLRMMLHCDDFSAQIGAARLYFVSGEDWPEQLTRLFARYAGMPLPQQFVRTALLEDADMAVLTEAAQAVISRETSLRSERLPEILAGAAERSRNGRVIVLAGSQINLGDLSNIALRSALLADENDSILDHESTASGRATLCGSAAPAIFPLAPCTHGERVGVRCDFPSANTTPHPNPLPGVPGRGERNETGRQKLDHLLTAPLRGLPDTTPSGRDASFVALDPDHPLTASPLALAQAAAEADAIVAADLFRGDLPGIVGPGTAWITWLTSGRIVAHADQGPSDALLLADPAWLEPARKAGWPTERVQIAAWPRIVPPASDSPRVLGVLADTRAIEIPQRVKDFSSQMLLWEMIEDELSRDPLSLGEEAQKYLQVRMDRFNIAEEGLDRNLFMERLIVPAYQQGLCRLVMRQGIPLALFGRGWGEISEFKNCALGPIDSVDDLVQGVSKCRAVLQVFPERQGAMGALPVPVIQPGGLNSRQLLNVIRQALNTTPPPRQTDPQVLARSRILPLILPTVCDD